MEEEVSTTNPTQDGVDQPPPEATPPQPPKPYSKSQLLWFGLGLLVVLGGGYYLLSNKMRQAVQSPTPTPAALVTTSPTTDPTANWQTYVDSHNGFSIKYPPEWLVREIRYDSTGPGDTAPSFTGVGFRPIQPLKANNKFTVIQVQVFANSQNLELEEVVSDWYSFSVPQGALSSAVKKGQLISVGGQRGIKIVNPPIDTAGLPVTWVLVKYRDKVFNLTVTLDQSYPDINKEEIFDLILSTFRFIEPNDSTDASSWKTYTNNKLGFSFKYPNYFEIKSETERDIVLVEIQGYQFPRQISFTSDPKIIVDYRTYPSCKDIPKVEPPIGQWKPCISSGEGWGQINDIEETLLGGRPAVSFYINSGVDSDYHVMQTKKEPKFEIKMYVSGGGLDQLFKTILSTFIFLR